jgi:dephospho-CoA kinase
MRLIGLTGGIASGKSLVSRQLQRLGAMVIDADRIARDVVQPGSPGWEMIVREFGRSFIDGDGGLDRKALGQLVFNNPRELDRLNRITHPLILAEIERLLQQCRSGHEGVAVLDAPLLFETGLDRSVDEVWVVMVDHQTQVKRLMERDRLTEQDAGRRILLQIPLEEKASRADRVIDNRGLPEETERQVRAAWHLVASG